MREKALFYRCSICGNMVEMIRNSGVPLVCCGKPMEGLIPNTTEAAVEKHLPVIERVGDTLHVKVGSVPHPMTEAHYIEWLLVTDGIKTQHVKLTPSDKPEAIFAYLEKADVYAYCNLHGLWKSTL